MAKIEQHFELWPRGYGWRLFFKRTWVQIPALLYTVYFIHNNLYCSFEKDEK